MDKFDLGWNGNGTRTEIYVGENELITRDVMDAQPILDAAAEMRSHGRERGRNGFLAATIPITIYYEWRKEWRAKGRDYWKWPTFLAMKINSRDWCKLRTTDMTL